MEGKNSGTPAKDIFADAEHDRVGAETRSDQK